MALQKWKINAPARECAVTGKAFAPEEDFTSFLFSDDSAEGEMRRVDVSEEALEDYDREHGDAAFSQWKSRYKRGVAAADEDSAEAATQAEGEDAEEALRRLCEEDEAHTRHSRYVLAVFLERKKRLKQVDRRKPDPAADSDPLIIYEHRKTGEVFVISEPEMDMEQLEAARQNLADYLG